MSQQLELRIRKLYYSDKIRHSLGSLFGFFLGVKICDFFFYDEKKMLKKR